MYINKKKIHQTKNSIVKKYENCGSYKLYIYIRKSPLDKHVYI